MPANIPGTPEKYDPEYAKTGTYVYWDGNGWTNTGIKGVTTPKSGNTGNNYHTKTCKLSVTYFANGATGDPPSGFSQTYSSKLQPVTITVEVKDNETNMSKGAGYYFLGWSTTSSGSVVYNPGDIIKKEWDVNQYGTETYNLYAVWTNHSIYIYRPDENSNETHYNYSDKPLNTPTPVKGAIFTRKGYTQVGWATSEGGAQVYEIGQTVTSTSDAVVVLYPVWQVNTYTVTYKANGGTGDDQVVSITFGADLTILMDPFTKTGYHIDVWNEAKDCSKSSWMPGATYEYDRDENVTLYAIWEGDEYYVIYDDGTFPSSELYIRGVLASDLEKDENDLLYSENLHITDNDLLYITAPGYAYMEVSESDNPPYSIATYGQPFYTERRPIPPSRAYYTFAGWRAYSEVTHTDFNLIKQEAWMYAYSITSSGYWGAQHDVIVHARWSNSYPFGKIFFGGKYSDDFGISVEAPPSYIWPEHAYEHDKVGGKNGDVLRDPNRFENVKKKYKISVYDGDCFFTSATKISDWLHRNYRNKYVRLEDSYEPDSYMLAVYEESVELENVLATAGKAEISFNCKPQRFLISGDREYKMYTSGSTIINPTNYVALPILKFYGTGTIKINGVELDVTRNYNGIKFDSETFDAVDAVGQNMNAYVSIYDKLRLFPGSNTITFTGDIYNLSIIPRWYRI